MSETAASSRAAGAADRRLVAEQRVGFHLADQAAMPHVCQRTDLTARGLSYRRLRSRRRRTASSLVASTSNETAQSLDGHDLPGKHGSGCRSQGLFPRPRNSYQRVEQL